METRVVRLFMNGRSQAVRLPAEFRFEGDRVYATRDERTGNVTLSSQPGIEAWAEFFSLVQSTKVPDEFMAERPMNVTPSDHGVFDGEV